MKYLTQTEKAHRNLVRGLVIACISWCFVGVGFEYMAWTSIVISAAFTIIGLFQLK